MNSQELEYAQGLSAARGSSRSNSISESAEKLNKIAKEAKNPAKLGLRLASAIDFSKDWIFLLMGLLALLKDLSDFIAIGSLPILGWFVTAIVSIGMLLLWVMTMVMGLGGKRKIVKSFMKQGVTLMIGTGSEIFLTGANLLPLGTITVIIMYILELIDRVVAKMEAESQTQ